jgi:hypothetical protein
MASKARRISYLPEEMTMDLKTFMARVCIHTDDCGGIMFIETSVQATDTFKAKLLLESHFGNGNVDCVRAA